MGLITKPTLGVIDSVAMACDSIRRAVDLGYDVRNDFEFKYIISFRVSLFGVLILDY